MTDQWFSQAGQDQWVVATFPDGYRGYFVEVGAYDGIQTSNTYALEQRGWDGVCVEAHPLHAQRCATNRRCHTVAVAATATHGYVRFEGDQIVAAPSGVEVPGWTLTEILDNVGAPRVIDYLSLDIEGGELDALTGLDLDRWHVNLISVEHNLYAEGPARKDALHDFLTGRGFERVYEDVPCLDPNPLYHMKPYEDWYMHTEIFMSV